MGSIHSELVGDELHIARTDVSTGNPNGNVTPGIIGEFYWDSDAKQLYVAESLLNNSWETTTGAFDSFLELTDTPSSYSGKGGNVVQVVGTEGGLEFGQALRTIDSPQFKNLILEPDSPGVVSIRLNESGGNTGFLIQLNPTASQVSIAVDTGLDFFLTTDFGSLKFSSADNTELQSQGDLNLLAASAIIIASAGDISFNADDIFIDTSTSFVGFGSTTPLAQIFVSSPSADIVPVSMQESLGSNGARIKTLVGTQDPEGNVVGEPGDHYWKVDGLNSTMFIKQSVGSSNTGWSGIFGSSTGVTSSSGLTDNFLTRGDGGAVIDIGNIFMSADGNDLTIPGGLDLENSTNPVISNTILDAGNIQFAKSVFVLGKYAYLVSSTTDSLIIFDVSDPTAVPVIVGTLADPTNLNNPRFIYVVSTLAYITSSDSDSLSIVDVSDPSAPFLVGQLNDPTDLDNPVSVVVVGKYAYIAGNLSDKFVVVDVSDPANPFIAGSLFDAVNLDGIQEIVIIDNFAYVVAIVSQTLSIIDISDPTNPTLTGFVNAPTELNAVVSLSVNGAFAFAVGSSSDRITSINISDPTAPTIVDSIVDSGDLNGANGIMVAGNFAYVSAAVGDALTVVDISDPAALVVVGTVVDGTALDAAQMPFVSGKYAYVPAINSLTIIDLHGIEASTANIGNIESTNINVTRDAFIKGNLYTGGLNVGDRGINSDGDISAKGALDVVPGVPRLVGSVIEGTDLNGVNSVVVVDNYAYVACSNNDSLTILDITEPTAPVVVGTLVDPVNFANASNVVVSGKYAYLTSQDNDSLNIIDVSDVFAPILVGTLADSGTMEDATHNYISGKYCYVVGNVSDSLAIVDISDPTTPVLAGFLIDSSNLNGPLRVFVSGNFAYVAVGTADRFAIIDISDPFNPSLTGSVTSGSILNGVNNVFVVGRYAYTTARIGNAFAVIDISDPTTPVIVGSVVDAVRLIEPFGLSVAGNYAYICNNLALSDFTVIDISDPTNPVITNNFSLGAVRDMFVAGKFAYGALPLSDEFVTIDLGGIDVSTANIGNVKATYLSVDNDTQIKGGLYAGSLNTGPLGIHSDGDISGSTLFATSPLLDTFPIARLKNSNALHPGVSNKFVGDRDPNGVITGEGGDVYFQGVGQSLIFGSFESRGVIPGDTVWFKRSVKPSPIVEINTSAEFEALASGGIIFVPPSTDLTLIFNITVTTSTIFILTGGTLNLTGLNQAGVGITYIGTGTLLNGGGAVNITGGINLTNGNLGTLMALAGSITSPILLNINVATLIGWVSLGSFSEGLFVLRFLTLISCAAGFTVVNPTNISAFNVGHFGAPMAGALFTVNTNNPLTAVSFNTILNTISSTGSVFDFNTRINPDVAIFLIAESISIIVPGNTTGPIFKQTTDPATGITAFGDASPSTGTITSIILDVTVGGSRVFSTTTYFEDEILTISGTTSYNGTFQITSVDPGVSFNINTTFVGSETGSIDSERLVFTAPASGAGVGDSLKITGTNFYNAFYTALAVGISDIEINGTFIATNTGTLEINLSLDGTDGRLFATDNVGISDSITLASAFVNDNGVDTDFIVAGSGVFIDIIFGLTQGSALVASTTQARWRMLDAIKGIFEFTIQSRFNGWITFDFSVSSQGGTTEYKFRFQISTDGGVIFNDLPDPIESVAQVGGETTSITKTFALQANQGDQIKPQVLRETGSSTIILRYATINIRQ